MKIIRTAIEMQKHISELKIQQKQIGYVATMGYLHEGHITLINQATKENNIIAVSIFVNPLQFGPDEDYERYPRDEIRDIKIADGAGVDVLFIPDVQEIYPKKLAIEMKMADRVHVLCGQSRQGHFDGVITVLAKLFNIIGPHRTYFGLKDAQQVAVVDALIDNLNFPIELVGVPTTREEDGLAKSSRNVFLSKEERKEAVWLYKGLKNGRQLVVDGEKNPAIIVKEVKEIINEQTTGKIDYVELLSYPELRPVSEINERVILAVGVYYNQARLIDNIIFDEHGQIMKRLN